MARLDLTDFELSVIEPLLPNKRRGVPPSPKRKKATLEVASFDVSDLRGAPVARVPRIGCGGTQPSSAARPFPSSCIKRQSNL